MKKKILHIDMDGVLADFDKSIFNFCPEIATDEQYQDIKMRVAKIDSICETNLDFFHNLLPFKEQSKQYINCLTYMKSIFYQHLCGMYHIHL